MISAVIPWSLLYLALIVMYQALSLWLGPLGAHLLDLAEWAGTWIPDPTRPHLTAEKPPTIVHSPLESRQARPAAMAWGRAR